MIEPPEDMWSETGRNRAGERNKSDNRSLSIQLLLRRRSCQREQSDNPPEQQDNPKSFEAGLPGKERGSAWTVVSAEKVMETAQQNPRGHPQQRGDQKK